MARPFSTVYVCDIWSSRVKDAFMVILITYIGEDYKYYEITMGCIFMPGKHTAVAIEESPSTSYFIPKSAAIASSWPLEPHTPRRTNKTFFFVTYSNICLSLCALAHVQSRCTWHMPSPALHALVRRAPQLGFGSSSGDAKSRIEK